MPYQRAVAPTANQSSTKDASADRAPAESESPSAIAASGERARTAGSLLHGIARIAVGERPHATAVPPFGGRAVIQRATPVNVYISGKLVELNTARKPQALATIKELARQGDIAGLREIIAWFGQVIGPDQAAAKAIADAALSELDFLVDGNVVDERKGMQAEIALARQRLADAVQALQRQRTATSNVGIRGEIDDAIAFATRMVPVGVALNAYLAGAGRNAAVLRSDEASRAFIEKSRDYQELVATYETASGLVGEFASQIWASIRNRVARLDQVSTRDIMSRYDGVSEAMLLQYDALLARALPVEYTQPVREELVFVHHVTDQQLLATLGAANIPAALALRFLKENQARVVAEIGLWDAIAARVADAAGFAALFGQGPLIPRVAALAAIFNATPQIPGAALASSIVRSIANVDALTARGANLNTVAVALNDAQLMRRLMQSDHAIARGDQVQAIVAGFTAVSRAALVEFLVTADAALLGELEANVALVQAAFQRFGVHFNAFDARQIRRALDYVRNNAALPAVGAARERATYLGARYLQNVPAATMQAIIASPLGATDAYVRNLSNHIDTVAGVVFDDRGGGFDNGAGAINFAQAIHVPVSVGGIGLTNHVIANLFNPRDAYHQVKLSEITATVRATNEQGMDYTAGQAAVLYQSASHEAKTSVDGRLITIFWR